MHTNLLAPVPGFKAIIRKVFSGATDTVLLPNYYRQAGGLTVRQARQQQQQCSKLLDKMTK